MFVLCTETSLSIPAACVHAAATLSCKLDCRLCGRFWEEETLPGSAGHGQRLLSSSLWCILCFVSSAVCSKQFRSGMFFGACKVVGLRTADSLPMEIWAECAKNRFLSISELLLCDTEKKTWNLSRHLIFWLRIHCWTSWTPNKAQYIYYIPLAVEGSSARICK